MGEESVRIVPGSKVLLASILCLAAVAASAQDAAKPPASPQNSSPSAPPAAAQAGAPKPADPEACLQETGDYVTRGKAVVYVIGIANTCDKRLRCEIYANVTGPRGAALGHTVMTLGAASSGASAKQTYAMRVKAAGGIAQVSRDCKAL
jgi:hypothetical protein